jgi:hypothetical protein
MVSYFVALARYFLSGESVKVGYLNGGRGKENSIHTPDKKKVLHSSGEAVADGD